MLSLSAAWKRAGDDHQCLADAGESSTVLPIANTNKNNKKRHREPEVEQYNKWLR